MFTPGEGDAVTRFGETEPEGTYIYTKEEEGIFRFNHEVLFEFVYLRSSKNQTKEFSYFKGFLGKKQIFELQIPIESSYGNWKIYYFEEEKRVDKIVVGPGLEMDNLQFVMHYNKLEAFLEKKQISEMKEVLFKNKGIKDIVDDVNLDLDNLKDMVDRIAKASGTNLKVEKIEDLDNFEQIGEVLKEKFLNLEKLIGNNFKKDRSSGKA